MRRQLLLVLAVAALAGCGEESGDESAAPQGGGEVEIVATDFAFDPDTVTVDAAGEVTFRLVNDGDVAHVLEVEGGDVEEETESVAPGKAGELTVDLVDGDYVLYCPIGNHREQGMEGKLVVGLGSPGTQTDEDEGDEGSGYGG